MIPLKLHIKNFLSYGPNTQIIDFTQHRLICLSGKNGHGKSALLDAITWSLWGQARKVGATSKPDHGLLRLGEVEMTVSFDFHFGNNRYRVRRDFSKKYGKPHSHVEFGILQEDDYFVSLTEKTIRKTQEKIEQTLGLDYETFANSSFLRQGGANEFSKKSAKERKEVLSTILGLHHYDKARSFVLENIRSLNTEKQHLEKFLEHTHQELESLATIAQEEKCVANELEKCEQEERSIQQKRVAFQIERQKISEKQQEYKLLSTTIEQQAVQERKQREQLTTIVNQWKNTHKLILALPDQAALETHEKRLNQKIKELQETLNETLILKEKFLQKREQQGHIEATLEKDFLAEENIQKISYERVFAEKEAIVKNRHTHLQKKNELSEQHKKLCAVLTELRKTLPPELLISDHAEQLRIFEHHKMLYQRWIEQGNWVNNELKELEKKKSLSQNTHNPSCPLCEQNLSQARKRFLHKKFNERIEQLTHRFNRLKNGILQLKTFLHDHHAYLKKVQELEQLITQETELNKQKQLIQNEIEALKKKETLLDDSLKQTKKELETLALKHKTLRESNKDLTILKKEIAELEKALLGKQYDGHLHKKLAQELADTQNQLKQYSEFPQHKARQQERQTIVHSLCTSLKQLGQQQKDSLLRIKRYTNLEKEVGALQKEERGIEERSLELAQHKEKLLQKKGNLEAQAQKRDELKKLLETYEKKIRNYATELQDLQHIAIALGKDGIQALLIEDAIPEIEQEANDLLARLTDNQASISIESLRDLKKGGTRETLDINISDPNGIRPYELFSGGEAFRIDFALRIAISKLLARRAGTSLQTLIIDEGFGSQDDEGLSRIMDALYTVQDDFEKVIIVSHLATMKEQFPVHYYIHKNPNGSTVTVIEQG